MQRKVSNAGESGGGDSTPTSGKRGKSFVSPKVGETTQKKSIAMPKGVTSVDSASRPSLGGSAAGGGTRASKAAAPGEASVTSGAPPGAKSGKAGDSILKVDVAGAAAKKPPSTAGEDGAPPPSARLTAANLEHHRVRTDAHKDVGVEGAEFAEETEGPMVFVRENWQVAAQNFMRVKLSEKNGRTGRMVRRLEQMRKELDH